MGVNEGILLAKLNFNVVEKLQVLLSRRSRGKLKINEKMMAVKYYSLCKLSSQAVMQSTFCLFPPPRLHQ